MKTNCSFNLINPSVTTRWYQWLFILFSMMILASCGGSSSGGGSGGGGGVVTPGVGAKLELHVLDQDGQTTSTTQAGTNVNIRVTAYNDFGNRTSNITVTFNTSIGSMSQETSLTDSSGEANVSLITTESQVGVATITASATVDGKELSLEGQVEITPFVSIPPSINLTVYDSSCTNQISEIEAGQSLCVTTSVFQQTTPYTNQVVEYTTTQGTPTPTASLTNDNGVSTTQITSTQDLLGASTITASTTIEGTTYSDSVNIQYTEFVPEPTEDPQVVLTIKNAECEFETNTAKATESLCLSAVLTRNGNPLANEIISFTAPVGSLRQAAGLTDSNGMFETQVDTLLAETGAATAIATYQTFSDSKNYQFIPQVSNSATLDMEIRDESCQIAQNSIEAGKKLCIRATLEDPNTKEAVTNALVTFSAPLGQVSPESVLTNQDGVATTLITSTDTTFGAAIATASYDGNSISQNYQFVVSPSSTQTDLTLEVRDGFCTNLTVSAVVGSSLCLHANLKENNVALPSKLLTFAAPIGTLEPISALTDVNGDAQVLINSIETDIGAATATVTYNEFTQSANYEFIRGITPQPTELSLVLKDKDCDQIVSSVALGDNMCVEAVLSNSSGDIAEKIISFAATLGLLVPNSVLTDNTGLAKVILDTSNAQLGAGIMSATFDNLTENTNYQIVAANSTKTLTVSSFESDCQTERNSFNAGSAFCLAAVLMDANAPIADEIINFDVPLGTLRQTAALTNSLGIATAIVDTQDTNLGAAQATVVNANLSDTTNYELIANDNQTTDGPQFNVRTLQNGIAENRITAGESLQIEATFLQNDGTPISERIVRFTVERGTLVTDSALTNNNGVAQVTLNTNEDNVGASAATVQVDLDGVTYTQTYNYEILSPDAVELDTARIGHFNSDGNFIEGKIGVSLTNDADGDGNFDLSAGGTMGLTVAIANQNNQRIIEPIPVSFTSTCASVDNATLDINLTTVNGEARSTYQDISCSSTEGSQDTIIATIIVNNVSVTANVTVDLLPDALGSLEFISADPTSIVLKGTGGQGKQETSTLTFRLNSELGNPVSQQLVSFSLDTDIGGLTVNPTESFTNSQGLVTTRVTAGFVPAAVRVTATSVSDGNISTQSDLLSVNTGLPDQNSITLATNLLNPEGDARSGVEAQITAFMADSFNNPVPDGTTVNFTTEGGFIQPSCNTTNGACNVTWTSTNPRVDNHRITVLATAIGHETLFDVNGNNVFDDGDTPNGNADIQTQTGTDSGLARGEYANAGFVDHSEAWRDDNENRVHDDGELFIDYNNDKQFNQADQKFNGPHCDHSSLCADEQDRKINVRRALVMIMSGSTAVYSLTTDLLNSVDADEDFLRNEHVIASNERQVDPNSNITFDGGLTVDETGTAVISSTTDSEIILEEGQSIALNLFIADDAQGLGQILPAGTVVNITTTAGSLTGTTEFTVPNSVGYLNSTGADEYGGNELNFIIFNTNSPTDIGDNTVVGALVILVTFPESQREQPVTIPLTIIGR